MKYVRCIYNNKSHIRLTINKIYEVINVFQIGNQIISIQIIDNKGDESSYFIKNNDIVWFEDATAYIVLRTLVYRVRDNKINNLLNED